MLVLLRLGQVPGIAGLQVQMNRPPGSDEPGCGSWLQRSAIAMAQALLQ